MLQGLVVGAPPYSHTATLFWLLCVIQSPFGKFWQCWCHWDVMGAGGETVQAVCTSAGCCAPKHDGVWLSSVSGPARRAKINLIIRSSDDDDNNRAIMRCNFLFFFSLLVCTPLYSSVCCGLWSSWLLPGLKIWLPVSEVPPDCFRIRRAGHWKKNIKERIKTGHRKVKDNK